MTTQRMPSDLSPVNLDVSGVSRIANPIRTNTQGTVTQQTNRTTGVTLNALSGTITTNNASLAAEAAATFIVTNSTVAATDAVVVCQQSGSDGGNTMVHVVAVAGGSFSIQVSNNNAAAGTAETGAILINFFVLGGRS